MKNLLIAVGLCLVMAFMLAVAGVRPAFGGGGDHRVTICHHVEGSGNTGNGYNIETVDKDSIANVDGSINGHGTHPLDIIPAFPAGSANGHEWGSYAGQGDSSWIGNNCAPPDTTTTTTTTEPPTTTTTTTQPPPFVCPDGKPPEPNPIDPNDNCKRPPVVTTTVTTTPPPPPPVTTTTAPEPPVTVPPPVTTPAPAAKPPKAKPPHKASSVTVTQKKLEKQLNQQAPKSTTTEPQAAGTLPNTGLPLGFIVLLGASLVGAGIKLRRMQH